MVTNPPIGSAIKGSTVIPKRGLNASNMITAKGPSIAVKKFGRSLDTAESSSTPSNAAIPFLDRTFEINIVTTTAQIAGTMF